MKNNHYFRSLLSSMAALAMSAVLAHAQTKAPLLGDEDAPKATPDSAQSVYIRSLLERNLPKWDGSLLTSWETPGAWEDNMEPNRLVKLLGEDAFEQRKSPAPIGAERFQDDAKVLHFKRAAGRLKYSSRKRSFTSDLKGLPIIPNEKVDDILTGILIGLNFPTMEAARGEVQSQMVSLGGENGKQAEKFPIYSFFQTTRLVDGIPVDGSSIRAAVNLRGEVQRLTILWPHFRVQKGAEMRARREVVDHLLSDIFRHDPTAKIKLAGRLVYSRTEKGEFLPAVQVDVSDGQTPYRLMVPVAI